jgi:two-component system, NarL family, invasion response regulator UvrY
VIRVLIADDHALVRSALQRCLAVESDIAVVGEAETPEQAIAEARALQPDLVLLDLLFPRVIAYEAIPRIGEVSPVTKVLVCSALADSEAVRLALATGAAGYVAKGASARELVAAIRLVAAGERYVDPVVATELDLLGTAALPEPMSDRERDVLHLLAFGYADPEIGTMLHISKRKVDAHRARIMRNLQLQTRAELVLLALAHGLISRA